jgi:hypothetical protein
MNRSLNKINAKYILGQLQNTNRGLGLLQFNPVTFYRTPLNRIVAVQECDATTLNRSCRGREHKKLMINN